MALISKVPSQLVDQPHITGLTSDEVQERIRRGETNAFEARVGRTYLQIVRDNIFNVYNIALFTLLLIVLLSQDYLTVLFAGFSVMTNSISGTLQEIKARYKLNQLAALTAQHVDVLRDGQRITIPGKELVLDDVIFIKPGDRLAVDGRVLLSDSLEIDESQLTGESEAIYKKTDDKLSSGSFCIAGTGVMVATRIGGESSVNRLTALAKTYKNMLTPTQKRIAAIVQFTMVFWAITAPMVFISGHLRGGDFVDNIRNTLVYTTTLVPQGMILVSILALTFGAIKISRHRTLIQRVNAVESMANVTVLCFDKTGTLTENKLAVKEILAVTGVEPDEVSRLLTTYLGNIGHQNSTAAAITRHLKLNGHYEGPRKIREIPFTSARKWGAVVLPQLTLILGAPERVFGKLHPLLDNVNQLSERGYRVLAFARDTPPPDASSEILISKQMQPLALIVIRDKVRGNIRDTLDKFRAQDVQLKVISGDNLLTVRTVAEQAGLPAEIAYTGEELIAMHPHEFDQAVQAASVFARIEPDTKRLIVKSLRAQGEYVAMVGDGVNDVPALKEANLAIAMNDGAQISKDISDIVLLNNALSTLPLAFSEGIEITQTLFGSTKMFLAKNLGNIIFFIFTLIMALPFPTTPIQISWAAFGTNNIPGGLIALGLLRPARIRKFRGDVMDYIITMGVTGSVGMILLYYTAINYTSLDLARNTMTLFFMVYGTIIVWNVAGIDIFQPRTMLSNPFALVVPPILTLPVLGLATLFPEIFEFNWPPLELLLLTGLIVFLCTMVVSIGMRQRGLLHRFYSLFQP